MRNAVTGFILMIIIILSGTAILTIESKTTRQNELDMNLGSSMEQTMKSLAADGSERFGDEEEMAADFIENFLVRTTSKSEFQFDILKADPEKGVLDVKVTERYRQIMGEGKAEARKTVILEQYDRKGDVFYYVSFRVVTEEGENIVKQLRIQENSLLEAAFFPAEDPVKEGYQFKGWMLMSPQEHEEKGQIYTREDGGSLTVSSDLILEAVFVK